MPLTREQIAQRIAQELRDVPVQDRWPEANVRLPAKTITVLRAGGRRDEALDPVPVKSVPVAGVPGRAVYTWRVRACTQPLQLDVWAHSDVARDDLLARLEPVLNASKARSMPSLRRINS